MKVAFAVLAGLAVPTAIAQASEYGPPGVMFAAGTARLDAAAQAHLDEAAAVLARFRALRLCVEGHVDGLEAHRGDRLDIERARVVREALRARGVPAAALGPPVGFAATRPREGRQEGGVFVAAPDARNRRVELRVPQRSGCEVPGAPGVDPG